MTSSVNLQSVSGPHGFDTLSESSPSRASYDNEAGGSDYIAQRTRSTFIGRLLHAIGMDLRRRKPEAEYFSTPHDEAWEGLLSRRGSADGRRYRRSKVTNILKRVLLALPVLALMCLGIIHIIQVLLGRGAIFWDEEVYDDFYAGWGQADQPGAGLAEYPTDATRDVIPIACHSHNDYWRRVPLFDALHWGCTGVEADVWLFDDDLFVGHNTAALTRNRTFQSLYVQPLVDLLDRMNPPATVFADNGTRGHGVFDEKPSQTLVLLVDLKTDGRKTFPHVQAQLAPLREKGYLTHWNGSHVISRAVTVVGTGNTPFDMVTANASYRDIFFDAPLQRFWEPAASDSSTTREDPQTPLPRGEIGDGLDAASAAQPAANSGQGQVGTGHVSSPDAFDVSNSYYASVSFQASVGFVWRGRLSARQLELVRGQIRGAQRRGLRVRYWNTPSWPVSLRNHVWYVLMREGADMLNVDDLRGAALLNWKLRVHGWW